jgi:small-conductance mechanosensitive channel
VTNESVCLNGGFMSILRVIVTAMLLALFSAGVASAQTVADYGAIDSPQSPGAAGETVGLYDGLSAEDYERVSQDISMLSATQFNLAKFRTGLIDLLAQSPRLLHNLDGSIAEMSPTKNAMYFGGVVLWILAFFAIAYVLERQIYGRRIVGPWFISLQKPNPRGIAEKLPVLAIRALLGLVGILISLILVGLLTAAFLDLSDPATQKTVLVVVPTIAIARASAIVWRMVISPYLPDYRIPSLSDQNSKKLFNWLWITVTISLVLIAFTYWIQDLGAEDAPYNLVTLIAAFIIMVVNVAMVVANRNAISQASLGDRPRASATWVALTGSAIWAPLVLIYLILSWAYQSYKLVIGISIGQPPIIGAYSVLLAVIVAYGVVAFAIARLFQHRRKLVEARAIARATDRAEDRDLRDAQAMRVDLPSAHILEGDPETGDGEEASGPSIGAPPQRQPSQSGTGGPSTVIVSDSEIAPQLHGLRDFEDLARRVATIFAIGAGIYALAAIWNLSHLFDEGRPLDRLEDIIDILLVGYVSYQGARIWIDTKIEEEQGDIPEEELGGDGGGVSNVTRLATLLPLFRNIMLFIIGATVLLLVMLEAGINVAPLFAGAGVVGLAIGFGAQALIRDILSGAFFLIDDAFRRGEYIDVGAVKGTVERISIRSFQLRHHLGALHTIPFGEIQHLTNFSRDWVMMKLPLRVTYDTDVEKVRKLIKKLGQELLDHPTEGEKFVQPLKSQGVYKMEDSAMIIRVKFMTRPGDQWTTRKLIYMRIREVFEENGIQFAHREVTVRLGDRKFEDLTEDEREAVAGAAQQATVAADEGMLPPKASVMDDR